MAILPIIETRGGPSSLFDKAVDRKVSKIEYLADPAIPTEYDHNLGNEIILHRLKEIVFNVIGDVYLYATSKTSVTSTTVRIVGAKIVGNGLYVETDDDIVTISDTVDNLIYLELIEDRIDTDNDTDPDDPLIFNPVSGTPFTTHNEWRWRYQWVSSTVGLSTGLVEDSIDKAVYRIYMYDVSPAGVFEDKISRFPGKLSETYNANPDVQNRVAWLLAPKNMFTGFIGKGNIETTIPGSNVIDSTRLTNTIVLKDPTYANLNDQLYGIVPPDKIGVRVTILNQLVSPVDEVPLTVHIRRSGMGTSTIYASNLGLYNTSSSSYTIIVNTFSSLELEWAGYGWEIIGGSPMISSVNTDVFNLKNGGNYTDIPSINYTASYYGIAGHIPRCRLHANGMVEFDGRVGTNNTSTNIVFTLPSVDFRPVRDTEFLCPITTSGVSLGALNVLIEYATPRLVVKTSLLSPGAVFDLAPIKYFVR